MRPYFSVIIPTFNRGNIISRTIESVIKQSFVDWELIIVDDGSTDDTKKIIEKFCTEDNRIIYVYQDNQERGAARNYGVKISRGKYVCFLDSDDEYLELHLSTIYDAIKVKNEPKGLFFTSLTILKNGIDIGHPIRELSQNDSIFDYLFTEGIYPCRVCIERNILNDFKFIEERVFAEDTILWLEIASKYSVFQISKKTVLYYQHEDNSVNKKNNPCKKMLKGFKKLKNNNPEVYNKISSNLKSSLFSDLNYGIAVSHIINSNRLSAIFYLIVSILIDCRTKIKHKILLIFKLITFQKMDKLLLLIG
jgi:glycosyltransferase involved in cell wall biosynthesis